MIGFAGAVIFGIWGVLCMLAGISLGRSMERCKRVRDSDVGQNRVSEGFRPVTFRCRNCGETLLQKYDANKNAYICSICMCETKPDAVTGVYKEV